MITGGILILIGSFFYAMLADQSSSFNIPLIVPPILYVAGALFIISPAFITEHIYSTPLKNWLIFLVSNITLVFYCFHQLKTVEMDLMYYSAFLFGFFLFIFLGGISLINVIRLLIPREIPEERKRDDANLLKIFSKRRKVTEEEVYVSKEKSICLVCKENLSRSIYLCPNCNVLYCSRCSGALSKEENACWVCDTPFDESRPVKREEVKKISDIVVDQDQIKQKGMD